MVHKTHKRRKSSRFHGNSTAGHGARKKWKKSGHRGGCGMAGTGKRADHKKSLVIKLYGNNYFGKQGVTSRGTQKDRSKAVNISEIEKNLDSFIKKFGKNGELIMEDHKILGDGEISSKLVIKARAFSQGAKDKIEKAGGKCLVIESVETKTEKEPIAEKNVAKKPKVKPKK